MRPTRAAHAGIDRVPAIVGGGLDDKNMAAANVAGFWAE